MDKTGKRGGAGGGEFAKVANNWSTPRVVVGEYTRDRGEKGEERLTLEGEAQNWPTPATRDYRDPNGQESHVDQLPNFLAHLWQTPGVDSFRCRGGDRKHEMGLDQQARSHSPHQGPDLLSLASDVSSNFTMKNLKRLEQFLKPSENKANDGHGSSPDGPGSRPRLSPVFEEWLMGFPLFWTQPAGNESKPSATPSCPPAQDG